MNDIVSIAETNEARSFWMTQGIGQRHLAEIQSADVLIVPFKRGDEESRYLFHQDTSDFYEFLTSALEGRAKVEICVDDDEYIEIALHSKTIRLSKVVVSHLIAPVVVGLLTSYVYDKLKAAPEDQIEASIVVEDHECKAFEFNYKGDAKDFSLLADKVGELARNCEDSKKKHKK